MEKQLRARLDKLSSEFKPSKDSERDIILYTIKVIEAIRAHIQETIPNRLGDLLSLDETLEILQDYR